MEEMKLIESAEITDAVKAYKSEGFSEASCNLFRSEIDY